MSAIQQLLQRWGFVKLSQYGLTLTPEGRVASSRPEVLRAADGSRIVGWRDEDLALTELQPWEPARPAQRASAPERPVAPVAPVAVAPIVQAPAPALRPAASMPAVLPHEEAPRPAYRQVISEASILAQVVEDPSEAVMVAPVADAPAVDEDDWEWTIALARARAEESVVSPPRPREVAASTPVANAPVANAPVANAPVAKAPVAKSATARSVPAPVAAKPVARPAAKQVARTSRDEALPARERTRPIAVVASRDPALIGAKFIAPSSGEWPETEATAATIDYGDDFQPETQTKLLYAAPPRSTKPTPAPAVPPRAAQPHTVIPVPALPTVQSAPGRMEPVVRAAHAQTPSQANRLAKGTGEVVQRSPSTTAMSEETLPSLIIGDRTTPGMQLPMAARAVQLPSVKRRLQQR